MMAALARIIDSRCEAKGFHFDYRYRGNGATFATLKVVDKKRN
jgi:hypothetical protein